LKGDEQLKIWKHLLMTGLIAVALLAGQAQGEAAKLGERSLSLGMEGEDVKQLQLKLAAIGFDPGPADGHFGQMTKSAIMFLQQVRHMSIDGVAGTATLKLLDDSSALEMSRGDGIPIRYKKVLEVESTAYSAASAGGNMTYSGTLVRRGVIAVDPRIIPMGTRVYVKGYGYAIAEDTGGAIKGNKIDVAMQSLDECYQWGVRDVKVYILD
jgi:3D (Asp-Asp-Asp) domain-containing protein